MNHLSGRVRVHLPLAAGHGDIDETAGVLDALLRAALRRLLLLLRLDLDCISSVLCDIFGVLDGDAVIVPLGSEIGPCRHARASRGLYP